MQAGDSECLQLFPRVSLSLPFGRDPQQQKTTKSTQVLVETSKLASRIDEMETELCVLFNSKKIRDMKMRKLKCCQLVAKN